MSTLLGVGFLAFLILLLSGSLWLLDLLLAGGVDALCAVGKVGHGTRFFLRAVTSVFLVGFGLLPILMFRTGDVASYAVEAFALAVTVFLLVRRYRRRAASDGLASVEAIRPR